MRVKNIIWEDFVNYKKPSLFIATTKCNFKCDKEAGCQVCQNSELAAAPEFEIDNSTIIQRYLDNPITEAIVIGGLEPFNTFDETLQFIKDFREKSNDDIVLYTGYYRQEISEQILQLREFPNIIVKYGRFIPNQEKVYDEVLGIWLANKEQYAVKLA